MMAGSCYDYTVEVLDRGLYDYPLLDPATAASGDCFVPLSVGIEGGGNCDTSCALKEFAPRIE